MFRVVVTSLVCAGMLAGAAACGDKELARLEDLRDEVCACKTPTCAETAMKKVPTKDVVSNHRTQRLARDMLDCLAKLYTLDRPSTDPDAPAPAPAAPKPSAPEPEPAPPVLPRPGRTIPGSERAP